MRKIKFRAWHAESKQIIYWPHLLNDPDDWLLELFSGKIKKNVLMQYTGLKDKNDKEVYEGDIVKRLDVDLIKIIDWRPTIASFSLTDSEYRQMTSCMSNINLFEIIGNIYENPELIKARPDGHK